MILTAPVGEDATTHATRSGLEARRVVAVDLLSGPGEHRTAMTTPVTRPDMRDAGHAVLAHGGQGVTMIHDSPGFVAQRILATILNIAREVAQMRLAVPVDIDRAVKPGLPTSTARGRIFASGFSPASFPQWVSPVRGAEVRQQTG